jgi:hypothetical protein
MPSFNDALDRLKKVLSEDAAIAAWFHGRGDRKLTVKRLFKHRQQVNASELPLIMITRPDLDKKFRISGGRENTNTVRLYVLFQQNDREQAQQDVVRIEELIDDCLTANYRLKDAGGNPLADSIHPTGSANDEGMFHPVYAIVMDLAIVHRRG